MRTRASHRGLAAVLCLGLAAPPLAHAAPPSDEVETRARRLFEAGSQAYDKARYAEAARAFGEAHRLFPRPAIAFSLAQALRRSYFVDGDRERLVRADALLEAYLREVPSARRRADAVEQRQSIALLLAATEPPAADPLELQPRPAEPAVVTELVVYSAVEGATASVDGSSFSAVPLVVPTTPGKHAVEVRAEGYAPYAGEPTALEGRMTPVEAVLTPLPATLRIEAVSGARVLLDGRELGFAPLPEDIETDAGAHRLTVTAPGREDFIERVTARRGASLHIDARTDHTDQRRAAWGLLGAGGGLAIVTGVTLGLALQQQGIAADIDEQRTQGNLSPTQLDDYNRALDRRDGFRGATIGIGCVAAVALLTGAVLILADRPTRRPRTRRSRVQARAAATPGQSASLAGRSGPRRP